ncbi:MAG: hypothetical protein KF708_22345, partial [Pirellulales bacterium]|nr:hypothetical protein [Pirellulales bacterium]
MKTALARTKAAGTTGESRRGRHSCHRCITPLLLLACVPLFSSHAVAGGLPLPRASRLNPAASKSQVSDGTASDGQYRAQAIPVTISDKQNQAVAPVSLTVPGGNFGLAEESTPGVTPAISPQRTAYPSFVRQATQDSNVSRSAADRVPGARVQGPFQIIDQSGEF